MGASKPGTRGKSQAARPGDRRSRLEGRRESKSKGALTWMDVNEATLQECLARVTEDGAAALLGKTSDGGALLFQVLDGAEREKWFSASVAEAHDNLQEIMDLYADELSA